MFLTKKKYCTFAIERRQAAVCYCACETFLHPALLDAAVQLTLQVLRRVILTALFGLRGPTLYENVQVGNIRKTSSGSRPFTHTVH